MRREQAEPHMYDGGGLKINLHGGDFPKSGRELCRLKR